MAKEDAFKDLGFVPEGEEASAELGFVPESPEDRKERLLEEQYGEGLSNQLKAGVEGAARGATFGLSDVALSKSGLVSQEALRERKERNPISSTIGMVAGTAAGLLSGSSEAGTLAKTGSLAAKKFATTNLVGQVAKGSAKIAENAVVNKILGKYGAAALGSAVEGAAYGAGNVVSEAALGDPNMNAERALSELGWSAVTGGLVGGAFSGASDLLPATFNKAKSLFDAGDNSATRTLSNVSGKVSGKNPETILRSIVDRPNAVTPEEAVVLARDFTQGIKEQYSTVNKAVRETFENVRGLETEQLLANQPLPKIQEAHSSLAAKARDVIDTIRAEPDLYPQRYARKIELLAEKLDDSAMGSAAELQKSINAFKQGLDNELRYGKMVPPELQDAIQLVGSLRNDVKTLLVDESTFGSAASRQAAVNEAFNEFKTAQTQLEKDLMVKRVSNSGRVEFLPKESKVLSSFKDPEKMTTMLRYQEASKNLLNEIEASYNTVGDRSFDKGSILSMLENNQKLQQKLAKGAEYQKLLKELGQGEAGGIETGVKYAVATKLFGPAGAAGLGALDVLGKPGLIAQRLGSLERMMNKAAVAVDTGSKAIFEGVGRSGFTAAGSSLPLSSKEYEQKVEKIQKAAEDPNLLMTNLEKSTSGVQTYAPNTANALNISAVNALDYLASKIPQTGQTSPLDSKPTVSAAERAKFARYVQIVERPASILQHVKNGTLVPEHIEAITAVYPRLLQEMQKKVADELMNFRAKYPKKAIPMRLQSSLSLFLGSDLSSALNPQSMIKNQAALAPKQPGSPLQGAVNPTVGGMKELDVSGRLVTPSNQSVNRRLE